MVYSNTTTDLISSLLDINGFINLTSDALMSTLRLSDNATDSRFNATSSLHSLLHPSASLNKAGQFLLGLTMLVYFRCLKVLQHMNYNLVSLLYFIETLENKKILMSPYYNALSPALNYTNDTLAILIRQETCGSMTHRPLSIAESFLEILKHWVNPALAVVGLAQNLFCVALLKTDGLMKASNILLLAVIVACIFQQLLSFNVIDIIEYNLGGRMYTRANQFFCVKKKIDSLIVIKLLFALLGTWGQYMFSLTFLMITSERFVAVFLPLKAKSLVTSKVVLTCVLSCYLVLLPWVAFKTFCFYLFEVLLTKAKATETFTLSIPLMFFYSLPVELVALTLCKCLPLMLVLSGSIAISLRVKHFMSRRRRLTSAETKSSWSMRTTKTLLATCLFFSLSEMFFVTLSYVAYRLVHQTHTRIMIQSELINLSFLITNCNTLLIFVLTNKKLWKHFKALIHSFQRRMSKKTSQSN
ncbi:G-protein coupled receptor [Biomphalaria glabrata]|nr:putative G-protein coupled receptor [Biomphalaria glabrata]